MTNCIFCKIINKEMPADIIYQDDKVMAFKDIKPVAPVHLLIIPKKHISLACDLELKDREIIGKMFLVAQKIAREQGVSETGYRLVINVGKDAGQTVAHLHLHLLGGEKLPWA
ncbi:MAG: histidine triad nucleotide-binding protein [Candidatus Nealsonbacteria bacterium]|nr:histidine triad nucleotide-binding protein [Candidatus Nealsonbacteria bacterium]